MDRFADALAAFADELKRNFRSGIPAQPEDQLKPGVKRLLAAAGRQVQTRTEAQAPDVNARPDIGASVKRLLCGFVELKAPGKGAHPQRYTGDDKEQWKKFQALPNLMYTDGNEWAIYRSGKPWPEHQPAIVRFSGDVTTDGSGAITDAEGRELHQLLVDFLNWEPIVPRSAKGLAEMLAPLCRWLREDVLRAVANPESNLSQLAGEWREYLFPDADDARFADAYAQTLTYAILLAQLTGAPELSTEAAARALDSGHGLLAQTLRVLAQPAARQEIEMAADLLERVIGAVAPTQLTERGDPWLYFYEDFLAAYDPKLRKDQGVYYTPPAVIGAQVRLAAELLETRFDKPGSYADDGVIFLDPAAGTAAYPLAAAEYAIEQAIERYGEGIARNTATRCAENIHAFENMVGPYAVAHLRLTQLLASHGGTSPAEGIRVFLTDTLESPNAEVRDLYVFARRLTEEHRRAQRVKSHTRVLVCMGNPPYDREQAEDAERPERSRKGGWVRHGEPDPDDARRYTRAILEDFVEPASAAGAGVHVKNLYNDYVYFWRWALWKLFENPEASGPGIISFITASSYLRGPGFVGMRQRMREAFDELWVIDLEGDNLGARKTENVFAIRTPVAIAVGVRYGDPQPETPARVHYTRIEGTREHKLARLDTIGSFADLPWADCPEGWTERFLPRGTSDYFSWPQLTDLFPWQHSGVQFKRTWPIGETEEVLRRRWRALLAAPPRERGGLMRETAARRIEYDRGTCLADERRVIAIAQLQSDAEPCGPVHYALRSLDRQWTLPDARLCDRPRPALWQVLGDRQLYLTTLITAVLGAGPAATASGAIPDLHHFCGRGGKDVIPLWRDAAAEQPNVVSGLFAALRGDLARVTAEDFFAYCYAVLATPAYVDTFSEDLTLTVPEGPRVPVTKDRALFRRAVRLGRRLLWLHTYGERFVPSGRRQGVPQGQARCRRGVAGDAEGYPADFSYDPGSGVLQVGEGRFSPVSLAVWEFSVSGLQVVHSWLSYRMRERAGRSSSPLDEIRPERWTADMTQELLELLWVLEATVKMFPKLEQTLSEIVSGPVFLAEELPQPADAERQPPEGEGDQRAGQQLSLD